MDRRLNDAAPLPASLNCKFSLRNFRRICWGELFLVFSQSVNDWLGRTTGYMEYQTPDAASLERTTVYDADGRQVTQTGTEGTMRKPGFRGHSNKRQYVSKGNP
jgi:hypothetical protein